MKEHCPDCQTGTLRIIKDQNEIKQISPNSRALDSFYYTNDFRTKRVEISQRILLHCDKCGHNHTRDNRTKPQEHKPIKIKGYGNHFRK